MVCTMKKLNELTQLSIQVLHNETYYAFFAI